MSYILDALRRADEARRLHEPGRAPGLPDPVAPTGPSRARRVMPLLLAAAALVAASVGWLAGNEVSPQAETGHAEAPAAPPPVTPTHTGTPSPPVPEAVATAPQPEPARTDEADRALLPQPAAPTAPRARATEAIAAVAVAPPVANRETEPANEPQRGTSAGETSVPTRAPEDQPILAWHDLPAEQRRGLPRPRLDVHVHADDPAARFVMVGMRKYREGDALPDGSVLERIERDGIQLDYRGQRYRLPRR